MKVGDLVKLPRNDKVQAGIVTDIIDKKVWRPGEQGNKVDWALLESEPHAVVLIGERYFTIPTRDLKVINEVV